MSNKEMDNMLSGIIVLILLYVIWEKYVSKCQLSSIRLPKLGDLCDAKPLKAIGAKVPLVGSPEQKPESEPKKDDPMPAVQKETMTVENDLAHRLHGEEHVTGAGPHPNPDDFATDDYTSTTIDMALESGVEESHKRYCNSLSFAGLPTGSSSCTTLEETGRSYGTADFVGLTARKFCKARQLAVPSKDVRTTPSQSIVEWCDVGMDELI